MPYGYFVVEQWKRANAKNSSRWVPICYLDAYQSLTKAVKTLEERGKPGLYRVVQIQRCLWAEIEDGKLKVHGCHASSAADMKKLAKLFERESGRRPVKKAQQERAQAKATRKRQ